MTNLDYSKKTLLHLILEKLFKKKIELKIKNNRSIFLNAQLLSLKKVKMYLHYSFLEAPFYILKALKNYILKDGKKDLILIRNFMESFSPEVGTSRKIDRNKLLEKGEVFDLKEVFLTLKEKYFAALPGIEELNITWFKTPRYKKSRSITFGSYDHSLKLIRINQLLDQKGITLNFVSFIVYHEMLHYVYPIVIGKKGRRIIHGPQFKEAEKKFDDYNEVKLFEKNFLKKRCFYGRT